MKNITHLRKNYIANFKIWKLVCLTVLINFLVSCDDFVDVDLPKNQLTAKAVFEDPATATAALRSIYAQMRGEGLVSTLHSDMGLYTDELSPTDTRNSIYNHSVTALDGKVSFWWSSTYNTIYAANSVIEGVGNSASLSLEDQNQLKGEALFLRSYLHALLVELYGPIPYISTTSYFVNTEVARMPVEAVYGHIITDLTAASGLLGADVSGERVRAYAAVADALLARVYLYSQQWDLAEAIASKVINAFVWEPDLNKVFLKNSSGSIWQFKPFQEGGNTQIGTDFIFIAQPLTVYLSSSILNAFEPGDLRLSNWIGSSTVGTNTWYYAFKYKQASNTPTSLEYPVMLRLAEQYLIRAEARAQLGNIAGAQADINKIRTRAGLPNTTAATLNDLLETILQERQVELFTEQGHRWFDLKRTGKAAEVLAPIKPGWQDTDILFPIPESEILLNPNLLPQNDGY